MLPKIHLSFERWRWNPCCELYVSTEGRVCDKSKKIVPPIINPKGYCCVYVKSIKKFVSLHRLVLTTWKPHPECGDLTIDHLDHNKRNNSVQNLEWVTKEENLSRAVRDLATKDIDEISEDIIIVNGVKLPVKDAEKLFPSNIKDAAKKKIAATLSDGKKRVYGGFSLQMA